MTRQYSAYGLDLESSSEIHGLTSRFDGDGLRVQSETPPIKLVIGSCPDWAKHALRLPAQLVYVSAQANPEGSTLFRLESLGPREFFRLSYADGTEFVADRETRNLWGSCPSTLTSEDLATYLLGPIMGFMLRTRGTLALHASCFCIGPNAFALCGCAGTGKSTAAAALALRGVRILCEDIAALRERGGCFFLSPGYPRINLWPDSAENLLGTASDLPKITPNWEKRFLPLDGKLAKFENQERPLAAIYVLEPRTEDPSAPRIEKVLPQEAALLLVQNTYMNYLLDKRQRAHEFDAIARLVAQVPVGRLIPSSDPAKLKAMCELLEAAAAVGGNGFVAGPSASRPG